MKHQVPPQSVGAGLAVLGILFVFLLALPLSSAATEEATTFEKLSMVKKCDELASLSGNPDSRAKPYYFFLPDLKEALLSCSVAATLNPKNLRVQLQYVVLKRRAKLLSKPLQISNYEEFEADVRTIAEEGYPFAYFFLSQSFNLGWMLPVDIEKSRIYFKLLPPPFSYVSLLKEAQNLIVASNWKGSAEAEVLIRKAVKLDVPGAVAVLGSYLADKSPKEAEMLLRKSAVEGHPAAMDLLAILLSKNGDYTDEALHWLKKAGEIGSPPALLKLEMHFDEWHGKDKNPKLSKLYEEKRALVSEELARLSSKVSSKHHSEWGSPRGSSQYLYTEYLFETTSRITAIQLSDHLPT